MSANPVSWSYFNVLEGILASLPDGDYSADVAAWSTELWKAREELEAGYPELFAQIHFSAPPGAAPYSPQVSDFFVHQAVGGVKQAVNPDYEVMHLTPEAVAQLRERNAELLDRFADAFTAMSRHFLNLRAHPGDSAMVDDHRPQPVS